jgi:hypothetical protein
MESLENYETFMDDLLIKSFKRFQAKISESITRSEQLKRFKGTLQVGAYFRVQTVPPLPSTPLTYDNEDSLVLFVAEMRSNHIAGVMQEMADDRFVFMCK